MEQNVVRSTSAPSVAIAHSVHDGVRYLMFYHLRHLGPWGRNLHGSATSYERDLGDYTSRPGTIHLILDKGVFRRGREGLCQYPDHISGCCWGLQRDEAFEGGSTFYVETGRANAPDNVASHPGIEICKVKHFVEGEIVSEPETSRSLSMRTSQASSEDAYSKPIVLD